MSTVTKRCFQLVDRDRNHNKFWTIEIVGKSFLVTYGRIGSRGATQVKAFDSERECLTRSAKKILEQTRGGYIEVSSEAHPGAPERTLEAIVSANSEGSSTSSTPTRRTSSRASGDADRSDRSNDRSIDI